MSSILNNVMHLQTRELMPTHVWEASTCWTTNTIELKCPLKWTCLTNQSWNMLYETWGIDLCYPICYKPARTNDKFLDIMTLLHILSSIVNNVRHLRTRYLIQTCGVRSIHLLKSKHSKPLVNLFHQPNMNYVVWSKRYVPPISKPTRTNDKPNVVHTIFFVPGPILYKGYCILKSLQTIVC